MEIPSSLKRLYRHWNFHTKHNTTPRKEMGQKIPDNIKQFIRERIAIWKRKTVGKQPPYTTDLILARYRFCNIFREFDRQTITFHTLLNPYRNNFPLWLLNMFYCRMVARPETIQTLSLLSFDSIKNKQLLNRFAKLPRPRFGNAYVFPVSAIQKSKTPTRELFITKYLPTVIPAIAKEIQSWKRKSVYDGLQTILPIFGFNLSFLWTEVLIDTAYQFPEYINLFAQFPAGPGSLPTLRKINPGRNPSLLVDDLASLPFKTGLTYRGKPIQLSAENWEGIGCEYRKYTNLKQGRGRRRIYRTPI